MTQEIEQTCYTLQSAPWLDNAGFQKGREHDRQALGFILPANVQLQIRQPDVSKGKARLRLLCNDSEGEKTITLSTSWQTVSTTVDTVPFIDTLFTEQPGEFIVTYQQPATTKLLPCWKMGQSEDEFFLSWEKNSSAFALVDLDVINMLLPYADRDNALNAGLSTLHSYYTQLFKYYNEWAGLSDNPDSPLNQDIANRYFIHADKHGVGAAYYSSGWCAQTSPTIGEGWIDSVSTQWVILHEIGHGYQGSFMQDTDLPTGEVWNNIYASYYQQLMLGQDNRLYTGGWLYNYGKLAAQEQQLITHITNQDPVSSWGLRPRLQFLMLMLLKAGTKAFVAFNQNYRQLANGDNFQPIEHRLADMLATAIATASGYDVTAFINLCGLKLKTTTQEKVASLATKPLWPLYDLLPQSEWENARQQLGLDSSVWLVDNSQLATLNKTGTLVLTFDIDDAQQIYGRTIIIKDNCGTQYSVPINDDTLTLNSIPVGVYQVELPQGRSQKYLPNISHITIREGVNAVSVVYSQRNDTSSRNVTLRFLGLGDDQFATLDVDYENKQLILDITDATPHSYFPNTLYASVAVLSANGEKVFERKMNGTSCTTGKVIIPFNTEYHLYIYHAEPGRLKASPTYLALVAREKYQLLRIDDNGLYNFILNNNPEEDLLATFHQQAQKIRNQPSLLAQENSTAKNDLWLMLSHFEEPTYSAQLKEYADVLPQDNGEPNELTGKCITLDLKGQGNKTFCQIAIDNKQHMMTIETRSGTPHAYYTANTYANITVTEPNGTIAFNRNYAGGTDNLAKSEAFALEENMIIDVFLDEPFRSSASNDTTQGTITLKKNNRWRVVSDGLEVYSLAPVDEEEAADTEEETRDVTALYGDQFTWQLLGDNDICFASMDMDIGSKQLTFTANSVVPHKDFTTTYTTVNVYNTRGSVVYRQSIKGSAQLGDYIDTAILDEGYTIEVFHAEAGIRSAIINPLNNKTWQQPNTVTWQVTALGLQRL
ncbi:viral enhancin protein [Klebsiella sp. RHBSTW-00215]|uniref:putative mucin/carbohydrate-binding domain-containing protein n=1 Tax=Klebsiella sp. RHBSTW-00215 TaxID=2742640 RepID=UPI0015F75664|nr:putative mucin/carbohydrate-binding domain-containing protein [Klebsiella sp. RHBSTW-00215]MBA7932104.1 viral enhancin protein [Klebsiella sp. RHBSTW-00215]